VRAQGEDAVRFLEQLVVGDIEGIHNGSGSLSMFTNEQGGIVDDTVVTKASPPPPPRGRAAGPPLLRAPRLRCPPLRSKWHGNPPARAVPRQTGQGCHQRAAGSRSRLAVGRGRWAGGARPAPHYQKCQHP